MSNAEETNKALTETSIEEHEPILFKKILCTTEGSNNWKLLNWNLDDFANKCGDLKLPFRVGKNTRTEYPQWEVETPTEYKTMLEFLNDVKQNGDKSKWFYCDYKHMSQWFQNKPEILQSINWNLFDLELDGSDSTMWIGSKGAHTNCHQDTYGCNLVAQIHGRKLWLLFSPDCSKSMLPTRIPYEESTIYSKYNFFSPSTNEIQAIKQMAGKVKMVILEPKDVLFIPKGWWHYVESIETSLSVNVWIPLQEDCKARLKETLVHLIINTLGDGILKADQSDSSLLECMQFLESSIEECKEYEGRREPSPKRRKLIIDETAFLQSLKTKYPNHLELLPNLTDDNINDFINKNNIPVDIQSKSDENNCNKSNSPSKLRLFEEVVDAFCSNEVVQTISQILINKFVQSEFAECSTQTDINNPKIA